MAKQKASKEKVLQYAQENPMKTVREIGEALDLSGQRVSFIFKEAGIDGKKRNAEALRLRDEEFKRTFKEAYEKDNFITTTEMMDLLGTNRIKTLQIAEELGIKLERKGARDLERQLKVIEEMRKENHTFADIAKELGITQVYAMRLAGLGREQGRDIPEGHLQLNDFDLTVEESLPFIEQLAKKGKTKEDIMAELKISRAFLRKAIELGKKEGYEMPKAVSRKRYTKAELEDVKKEAVELRKEGKSYVDIAEELGHTYAQVRGLVIAYEKENGKIKKA